MDIACSHTARSKQVFSFGGRSFPITDTERAVRRIDLYHRDRFLGILLRASHYRCRFSLEFELIAIANTVDHLYFSHRPSPIF